MGFDLYGIDPVINYERKYDGALTPEHGSPEYDAYIDDLHMYDQKNPGVHFRLNIWWWHTFWDVVCLTFADTILTDEQKENGHFNDGIEITERQAILIAENIREFFKTNKHLEFELQRLLDPQEKNVKFEMNDLKDFASFCEQSGGFNIC